MTNKSAGIRIDKVYTKSGDKGKTRLIGGLECWKDDIRVEAYGTIDELNSIIGLCRELLIELKNDNFKLLIIFLKSVQNELFNIGTQLAAPGKTNKLPRLSSNAIELLESEIDKSNKNLPELDSFVLPGGSIINSQFHIARNVCRRAERCVVNLLKDESKEFKNIQYLNRLSDALFVWSRWISYILEDAESLWEPNKI